MARGRNNQMRWDNVGGNGLSDAVGNAAVATAGLVEANNGIAGLADKFINLGEGISKKATERRNKALDDYTNNLFNESLQGAMNEDGTVNSGKLIQNLQTFRARDKANGEFWGDEEVGKKIGELTLKYNDSFTRNLEAVRSAKADEWLKQQALNSQAFKDFQGIVAQADAMSTEMLKELSLTEAAAKANNITIPPEVRANLTKLHTLVSTLPKRNGKPINSLDADAMTALMKNTQEIYALHATIAKQLSDLGIPSVSVNSNTNQN